MPTRLPRRLARLPRAEGLRLPRGRHVDVRLASSFRARLLGLAFLAHVPPDAGLLLPHTRAVHTFGMRLAVDLLWLRHGQLVRVDRAVPPRRLTACRQADAVVELPSARRVG